MKKQHIANILNTIIFLVILLWSYTAASKLADISDFKHQLYKQNFNNDFAHLLLWMLPTLEIIAACSLLFNRTRFWGLIFSLLLMLLFTGYILLILLGYFDKVPCSCGGVLKVLNWQSHLLFNLFYIGIISCALYLTIKSKKQL